MTVKPFFEVDLELIKTSLKATFLASSAISPTVFRG